MILENAIKKRLELHEKILKFFKGNSIIDLFLFVISDQPIFLNPQEVKKYWEEFIRNPKNKKFLNYLNFYIHIPFCQSKCFYCMYPSWPLNNLKELDVYIQYLVKNFQFFSPIFKTIKFRNLYIGGGTPSILTPFQIKYLFYNLFKYFSFEEKGQRTIECNPASVNLEKLRLFKKFNFNRISFGVQSTNKKVLKISNRGYQNLKMIKNAINYAKKLNFLEINVDLMLNLPGDKPEFFQKSFSDIAKLKPHNITIYSLLPPNEEYCKKNLKCTLKEYYQNYLEKIKPYLKLMKKLANKFGYCTNEPVAPWKFSFGFRKKSALFKFEMGYEGEFQSCIPSSTFGLGIFSVSHIRNLLEYRQKKKTFNFNPEDKIYQGRKISDEEEMLRFIAENIENYSKISLTKFQKLFGVSLVKKFLFAIKLLQKLNKVKLYKDNVYFFLPTFKERFLYSLFFIKEDIIKNKIMAQEKLENKIFIREKSAQEKRYWVRLTKVCNNNCIFCLDKDVQDGTVVPFTVVKKELIKGRKEGAERVILSGGEPTLHPKFIEIVKTAKKIGYKHIQVITNGRLFAYKTFLESALKAGITEITFSLHGHTEKLHEKQTQTPGSFKQSLMGLINALKVPNLIVSVDIVINKINYKYLPEILKFYISLGVKEFDLLHVIPFGQAWKNKEKVLYNLEKALPYLKKAFELSKLPNLFIWTNRMPPEYLEDFEELIQHPTKLFDEVKGREEIFKNFFIKGEIMPCWGERCNFCFLKNFCKDVIKLKKEKVIESFDLPFCLRNLKKEKERFVLKKFSRNTIYEFLNFYIKNRYFVKSLRCRKCRFFNSCNGMDINYIRRYGFKVLSPL
jgi:coproporphyrinogen III oxidase-like Fe-S oxidoreductase/pyruvate-formate lyase-activating enzyme